MELTPLPARGPVRLRLPCPGAPRRSGGARPRRRRLPDQGGNARRGFARDGAAARVRAARPGRRGQGAARHPVAFLRERRRRSSMATTVSVPSSAHGRWRPRWISRASHGTGFRRRPAQQSFRPGGLLCREGREPGLHRRGDFQRAASHGALRRKTRFLGTNPVAIGIPAGEEDPLIFDASTSVVARGKIIVAAHTNKPIPEGWAIDPEGYPTTDPEQALAGAVLPFGGPKGSAISFIIDIFCGVMTGASFALAPEHAGGSRDRTERRPCPRGGADGFVRPRRAVQETNGCHPENAQERRLPRLETHHVLAPGEIESRQRITNARNKGSPCPRRSPDNSSALARSSTSRFRLLRRCPFLRSLPAHEPRRRPRFQFPADSNRRAFRIRVVPHVAGSRAIPGRPPRLRRDRPRRARVRGSSTRSRPRLDRAAIEFSIYDQVTADSGSTLISEAVDRLKTAGADLVVGVGGGSALDTAKAVAALATNPGSPLDYVGLHKIKNRPLPTIAIPTTAGTGSEVSLWSVFTDDARKLKVAMGGVLLYPTRGPVRSRADDGATRGAHGVYRHGRAGARDRVLHQQGVPADLGRAGPSAIELVGSHLRTAVLNGRDRESRYAMLLASTMAGMAMNPTRLGLAHALAMPLGSWSLKIPHSIAIAVTLPLVMQFNCPAAPERFASVARALGRRMDGGSTLDAANARRRPSAASPTRSASRRACRSTACARTTCPTSSTKR